MHQASCLDPSAIQRCKFDSRTHAGQRDITFPSSASFGTSLLSHTVDSSRTEAAKVDHAARCRPLRPGACPSVCSSKGHLPNCGYWHYNRSRSFCCKRGGLTRDFTCFRWSVGDADLQMPGSVSQPTAASLHKFKSPSNF